MSINQEQDKKFGIETKVNCFEFSFYVYADTKLKANILAVRQMKTLNRVKTFEILRVQECQ